MPCMMSALQQTAGCTERDTQAGSHNKLIFGRMPMLMHMSQGKNAAITVKKFTTTSWEFHARSSRPPPRSFPRC